MIFEKDLLYPGTYHLPDGRKVTYTQADVNHLGKRLKEMVGAGLQVPVAWEHQDDAVPMSQAQARAMRAKFTLGHATDAELSPEGFLKGKVDVPVDDDAKRLPAVRFVSPEIRKDWTDGNGRLWPGLSITHLAVTPRPVQHKQQPFKPVQMSAAVVRLSLADVRLGDDMADEDKDKEEKESEEVPEDKGDEEKPPETPADSGGMLAKVVECLAGAGIVLGDGVTSENLLERLYAAAETKKAAENPDMAANANNGTPTEAKEPGGGYTAGPVAMSLERHPAFKAMQRQLQDSKRAELKARIKRLLETGRATPDIAKALQAEADKVQLSFDTDGEVRPTPVTYRVEAYEQLPPDAAWPSTSRLSATEAEEPAEEEKAAEQAGNEWAADYRKRRGIKAKK